MPEGLEDELPQERLSRSVYPPQLVLVDGGQPQVAAAERALAELGVVDVTVAGLAKRMEEIWQPGADDPVILPRGSEALYLLQRVRDEAHRFAITFHRQKRSKSMTESLLDDVPGLGEVRRKALVKHFGSVKALKAATAEQLAEVPGIGKATAAAIASALATAAQKRVTDAGGPKYAINTATGEIIEEGGERSDAASDGTQSIGTASNGTTSNGTESNGTASDATGSEGPGAQGMEVTTQR